MQVYQTYIFVRSKPASSVVQPYKEHVAVETLADAGPLQQMSDTNSADGAPTSDAADAFDAASYISTFTGSVFSQQMSNINPADDAPTSDAADASDAASYVSTFTSSEFDNRLDAAEQRQFQVPKASTATEGWDTAARCITKWMQNGAPPLTLDDVWIPRKWRYNTPLNCTATWKRVACALLLQQRGFKRRVSIAALGWIIEKAHGVHEATAFHRSAEHCTPTQCCLLALYYWEYMPTGFLLVDLRHNRRRLRIQWEGITLYKPFPNEQSVPLVCVGPTGRICEFRLVHLPAGSPRINDCEAVPIWRPWYKFIFSEPAWDHR